VYPAVTGDSYSRYRAKTSLSDKFLCFHFLPQEGTGSNKETILLNEKGEFAFKLNEKR
jgi:hypothetical protein